MMRGLMLLLLAAGLAVPPPCARAQEKNEWRTAYGGPKQAIHIAVTRLEDYRNFFGLTFVPKGKEDRPKVDFARQMLIGICLGQRPTGGYGVEFLSAEKEGKILVVRYEEVRPRGFVTQALTAPCLLKVLPRPGREEPDRVIFERTTRQRYPNDLERRSR